MEKQISQNLMKELNLDTRVLLVEDDEIMRLSLDDRLQLEKIPVSSVSNISQAKIQLEKGDIDLVVSDIRLPDGTGIELFEHISASFPGLPVILMTAYGDIADAVKLVKAGAVDYLTKPFDMSDFINKVKYQLSRIMDVQLTVRSMEEDDRSFKPGSGLLGKSPAMRKIERLVARLRDNDSSVLISGESGVGKEVIASLIHHNSPRSEGPMVKFNCAALSPGLIESELFGHEKGAFTGATQQRIGRFEQAQGGTIFLDEIGEISLDIQIKLLRVLQEREIERVGGNQSIPLDLRVIAATQTNLEESINANEFRSDLYWRLNVINIHIPPLSERREDIIYLARLFVSELTAKGGNNIKGLSKAAEKQLQTMSFPGNVRELKNIIERAVALCDGTWIGPADLLAQDTFQDEDITLNTLKQSIEEAEINAIQAALTECDSKINQAADLLGISRKNLWQKMKRYRIEK